MPVTVLHDVEHGGRGLSRDDARSALTLLALWEVPHVPRGSGLPLAAPTIQQWSSDETKASDLEIWNSTDLPERAAEMVTCGANGITGIDFDGVSVRD